MQLKRKSKTSGHFRKEHREYFIGVYTQIGKKTAQIMFEAMDNFVTQLTIELNPGSLI